MSETADIASVPAPMGDGVLATDTVRAGMCRRWQIRRSAMTSKIRKDNQHQNQQGGQQGGQQVGNRKEQGTDQNDQSRQHQQESGDTRKPGKDPDVMEDESTVDRTSRKPRVQDDGR
jgi:hypothetical protein